MGFIPPNDDPRPIAVSAALVIPPDGWDITAAVGSDAVLRFPFAGGYFVFVGDTVNKRLGTDESSTVASVTVFRDGVLLVWGVDITYVSAELFTVADPLVIGQKFRVNTPFTS